MKKVHANFIKRILALTLILAAIMSAVGCDGGKDGEKEKPPADTPVLMWKTDGLFALIPPPTTEYGKITADSKELIAFETYYVEKTDFSLYVQLCTEKGYTYSVINSEFFYSATNPTGHKLSVQFNDSQKTMRVSLDAASIKIKVTVDSEYFKGLQYDDALDTLKALGFTNISVKITELPEDSDIANGTVESVRINSLPFEKDSEFLSSDPVTVRYCMRSIAISSSSADLIGKSYAETEALLKGAGFINITCKESIVPVDSPLSESLHGSVFAISVNGRSEFEKGERFSPNSVITVTYYSFNVQMDSNAESLRFQDPEAVEAALRAKGFRNITVQLTHDISGVDISRYDGTVASVSIGGNSSFSAGQIFERSASVVITYYRYNITIEASAADMKSSMLYYEAEEYLKGLGFTNVTTQKDQQGQLITGWMHVDGEIYSFIINGKISNFSDGAQYPYETPIVITYYFMP